MTKREDGGPAFPVDVQNDDQGWRLVTPGMSLRDAFALAALQGWFSLENELLPKNKTFEQNRAEMCGIFYGWADAMLVEREK